jgi:midasin
MLDRLYAETFGHDVPFRHLFPNMAKDAYQVGMAYLRRNELVQRLPFPKADMRQYLAELESIMICVQQNMPCIIVGASGSGKSTLIRHVAAAAGADLVVFPLNSDIDTMDLVGGFEQLDPQRQSAAFLTSLSAFLESKILGSIPGPVPAEAIALLGLCQNAPSAFEQIRQLLGALYAMTSLPEIPQFVETCQFFIDHPNRIESARFEWVDGVLVKALEQGKWLVLDNANLCSSSVLDRLNGLLEPNGTLIINEHCNEQGDPKVVKPHPNFRLFMTMDSRFGELSRAMRNRAIEIYLDTTGPVNTDVNHTILEASQQRFGSFIKAFESETSSGQLGLLTKAALDHLSGSDMELLPRFAYAVSNGLVDRRKIGPETESLFKNYLRALQSGNVKTLGAAVGEMYDTLAKSLSLPQSFKESQVSDLEISFFSFVVPLVLHVLIDSLYRQYIRFPTRLWFHCCNVLLDLMRPNDLRRRWGWRLRFLRARMRRWRKRCSLLR